MLMLKWIWIAPVVLLAGCSKSDVATTNSGKSPVGYAQPSGSTAPPTAEPLPAAPLPADSTQPVAPAPRSSAVLPSGTGLHVRIDQSIDTRRNRPGDRFSATLTQPVEIGGKVLLPAGTAF